MSTDSSAGRNFASPDSARKSFGRIASKNSRMAPVKRSSLVLDNGVTSIAQESSGKGKSELAAKNVKKCELKPTSRQAKEVSQSLVASKPPVRSCGADLSSRVAVPCPGVPTSSVLDRAAEAIVFDLVSLESPVASQGCFYIDPNSSFGKIFFWSCSFKIDLSQIFF